MKAVELKNKSTDELQKLLIDLRKDQMNMRFQKVGAQLANTSLVRKVRRDIARIKTVMAGLTTAKSVKTAKAAKPETTIAKPTKAKAKA